MSNVPQARPVYLDIKGRQAPEPADLQDTHRETKWHNPTERVVKVDIFVGTPTANGLMRPPRNYEEKTGRRLYVFKPGETKSLSSDFDNEIQQTQCKDPECITRPFACRDPEHVREIVGGQAPMLENLGLIMRPTLAKALDNEQLKLDEAERKAFDAFKQQQMAMQVAAHAKAEAELAREQMEAKARAEAEIKAQRELADLEAATAPPAAKHQPKTK